MGTRVVFDTNVWLSAYLFGGKPKKVIDLAYEKGQIFCSIYILDETRRVLRDDFHLSQNKIDELTEAVLDLVEIIPIMGSTKDVVIDPKDNPILETAIIAKADYLVTGDKHLLVLSKHKNIQIIKVNRFLEEL
jgi:putative PIN family toxin of toxin-antitoxin system